MPRITVCYVVLLLALAGGPAAAQGSLQKVEALYAAAAYEDALAALGDVAGESLKAEAEEYRALCLIALDRAAEARQAIERMVAANPAYMPAQTSPRIQTLFAEVRTKLLPEAIKMLYADAKRAFEAENRPAAHAGFERVVQLIDSLPESERSGLTDLRMVAGGFLELARAPAAEAAAANPAPATLSVPDGNGGSTALLAPVSDTRGPLVIRQNLPVWNPSTSRSPTTREYQGRIRVSITAEGTVSEVAILQRTVPAYDVLLVQAARQWQYEPALAKGQPIPSTKEVEVLLRPK